MVGKDGTARQPCKQWAQKINPTNLVFEPPVGLSNGDFFDLVVNNLFPSLLSISLGIPIHPLKNFWTEREFRYINYWNILQLIDIQARSEPQVSVGRSIFLNILERQKN